MQLSLTTLAALLGSIAAFDAAKDSCTPEAHIFKGVSSPGFIACEPQPGGKLFTMLKCGDYGTIAYMAKQNRVSVQWHPEQAAAGRVVRRNLYGACNKAGDGPQIAHISISTPLQAGITAGLHPGFNRPCSDKGNPVEISFSLYDLNHDQLEQCYAHPLKPITG